MSAVIYAAIVVIWLIVLVPMFLRRHEANLDERSSERFDGAMRVLARRHPVGHDRRYTVMPRRSAATPVRVSELEPKLGWRARHSARVEASKRVKAERAEARIETPAPARRPVTAAVRRRRTLLALAAVSLLCLVLVVAGVVPAALQLVPELLLVGFVVHLRRQAKLTAARRRRAPRPAARPATRPAAPAPAADLRWEHHAAAGYYDEDDAVADVQPDAWIEEPVAMAAGGSSYDIFAETTPAPEVMAAEEPSTWEPRPVPPPTYSLKPAAPPRGDERWLAVDDLDRELADDPDGTELDAILDPGYAVGFDQLERRRAVND